LGCNLKEPAAISGVKVILFPQECGATPVVDFFRITFYQAVAPPKTKWAGPPGLFCQYFAIVTAWHVPQSPSCSISAYEQQGNRFAEFLVVVEALQKIHCLKADKQFYSPTFVHANLIP